MGDFDVYQSEMTNRFSERDIERLFSGETPEDEGLARLAAHVEAWHAVYERVPSDEEVATFAAEAAEIAASTPATAVPRAAPAAAVSPFIRFKSTLRQKLATGLAAVLLLSGMTGVGVASDAAAPGDTLYGLDQTLETFGILDGGAAERIAEAQSLFDDGLVAEAIGHAAGAVERTDAAGDSFSPESSKAAEALTNAADQVMSEGEEPSADVRSAVQTMLAEMANMIEDPQIDDATFDENVSNLAKEISSAPDELPDAADDAADNAADEAEENGEQAEENGEDARPPEDVPVDPPEGAPGAP